MKRTGRPRVDPDDDSVQVCVTLPARVFDQLDRQARRADVSLAEVIRQKVAAATLRDPDPD